MRTWGQISWPRAWFAPAKVENLSVQEIGLFKVGKAAGPFLENWPRAYYSEIHAIASEHPVVSASKKTDLPQIRALVKSSEAVINRDPSPVENRCHPLNMFPPY